LKDLNDSVKYAQGIGKKMEVHHRNRLLPEILQNEAVGVTLSVSIKYLKYATSGSHSDITHLMLASLVNQRV
jgi:hypothetical protein